MPATAKSPERAEKDPKPAPKKVQEAIDYVIKHREKALRELEKH